MAKMTPEQEAQYALDFGVARSDLPEAAQLAYDGLAAQRARAVSHVRVSGGPAEAASARVVMPKWVAAAGTVLFALITQGAGVVLLPYAFTRWHPGPAWPLAVRALGVALIAAGGMVVIWGFTRFATEGTGIPVPGEPTSRRLTVGGPYRYVRNPLYLAIVTAITGQALLLSRAVLLVYAAAILTITVALAHWIEDPALARRFGAEFEVYRRQVPGWWPHLPGQRPRASAVARDEEPVRETDRPVKMTLPTDR
jgi:protein-S-isoprenylcysteine O-methyltransferase Ste14